MGVRRLLLVLFICTLSLFPLSPSLIPHPSSLPFSSHPHLLILILPKKNWKERNKMRLMCVCVNRTTSIYSPNTSNPGPYLSTLKQIAFWRFDKNGAVQDYDAWIPNLNDWNYLAEGKLDITNPEVQAGSIQNLCGNIENFCTGSNQVYNEFVPLLSHPCMKGKLLMRAIVQQVVWKH